ncbi:MULTISPECIES: DUF397 domain-containing protein [Streptomyces]|uniref:DUF397 domain-containing protein n=1 Tax=Streptomyces TaxID=1883 RepID=UPI00163C6956|nr:MULTISPECIES: DUF397 domain-containing protein [Streptomyces]MBC2873867.1 DUF397 domain-containing protein [Streptomyces sp. TYQ1024]UBI39187.1 DUF397 domain-containing protein [Streptomyces mobaraensis]UKW31769.1 DUF397 domain-containing protein [Streptomyces sp. TYQ1024]
MKLNASAENGSATGWIKSSHSGANEPSCVEVAATPGVVRVRDSKKEEGPSVAFPAGAWISFMGFASGG